MLSIARGSDRPPVRCICRICTTTSRTFWVASLQILLEKDEILTYGFSVVYLEEIILGYQSYPDGKGTQNFPHVYLPVTCEYGSKFEFHVLFCGPKFVAFCIPYPKCPSPQCDRGLLKHVHGGTDLFALCEACKGGKILRPGMNGYRMTREFTRSQGK